VLQLPGFLVRKLGPRGRRALAAVGTLLLAGAVAAAIVLVPRIDEAKRNDAARERQERAQHLAQRKRELKAESRPQHGRAAPAPAIDREDRAHMVNALERAITRDARARVARGTLAPPAPRFGSCEPVAGTPDALAAPRLRVGRYYCVAVTSEIPKSASSAGGVVGHPFRAVVDFQSGRLTWCKFSGHPGEGSFTRRSLVRLPRACS
jgi:hypothetical protein